MGDDNIASLVEIQKARAARDKNYSDHIARVRKAQSIVANAIQAMRKDGVKQSEIADVLRHAARDLG